MLRVPMIFQTAYSPKLQFVPEAEAEDKKLPTVASFPKELIFKILCRLDYRELIHSCRLVCKEWKEIVQLIPSKTMVPKEFWSPRDLFLPEEALSEKVLLYPAERLAWGWVKRYRQIFDLPPQKIGVPSSQVEKIEPFKIKGSDKTPEIFAHTLEKIFIVTQAYSYLSHEPRFEIQVVDLGDRREIMNMKYPQKTGFFLRDVQYRSCRDLLIGRLTWNRSREGLNTEERVQVLFLQFTTCTILLDSENTMPVKLFEIFKNYCSLRNLEIKSNALIMTVANDQEEAAFHYNLDCPIKK